MRVYGYRMAEDRSLEDVRTQKLEELKDRVEGQQVTGQTPSSPLQLDGQAALTEAANAHDVLLVDFHADWCGPCQMLAPIVEEIAAETEAAVGKVDIDAHQRLASKYDVRGVPTLVIFADGDPVDRIVGVKQKPELVSRLRQYGDI